MKEKINFPENEKAPKTIGELKEMPKEDGYGELPTLGEAENWSGFVENW